MEDFDLLQEAIGTGDIDLFEKKLRNIKNINATEDTGLTILHLYVLDSKHYTYKPIEVIDLLLKYGFDINSKNKDGNTPLHLAVSRKNFEIVKALVKGGAEFDVQNNTGNSPLLRAVADYRGEAELLEIIKFIVAIGADGDLENSHGFSPKSIVKRRHESMSKTKQPREWDLEPHLNWEK